MPELARMEELERAVLVLSDLNPRQIDLEEGIEDLGASLQDSGQLENLVGRRRPDGSVEVFAGGRRLRGFDYVGWDRPVRVLVYPQETSDAECIALALAENLARRDMHWLDEATAIARALEGAKRGDGATEKVAAVIGRTTRSVQQYAAVGRNLVPGLQEAARRGKLTFEGARELAGQAPLVQERVLARFKESAHWNPKWVLDSPEQLRLVRASSARFDLSASGLEVVKIAGQEWCDREPFLERQRAALSSAAAERTNGTAVVVQESRTRRDYSEKGAAAILGDRIVPESLAPAVTKSKEPVVVINLNPETGEVREGAWDPGARASTVERPLTTAVLKELARTEKSWAVQRQVLSSDRLALQLGVAGLLGSLGLVGVIRESLGTREPSRDVGRELARLALPGLAEGEEGKWWDELDRWWARDQETRWSRLSSLPEAGLRRLFRVLIALSVRVGGWGGGEAMLADLAAEYGVRVSAEGVSDMFLRGCRRPRLEELAVESGAVSAEDLPGWQKKTARELREHILAARNRDWLPRELLCERVASEPDEAEDVGEDDQAEEADRN